MVVKIVMIAAARGQRLGLGDRLREVVHRSAAPTARRTRSRTGSGPAAASTSCMTRRAARRATRWPPCSAPPWASGGARRRSPAPMSAARGVRDRVDRAIARDDPARDGPAGALDGVPRLGRLGRAVHRPVRHRLGHHAQLLGHRRRCTTPTSPWSRPGIAEALFATAIGLVAAIPAVLAYNRSAPTWPATPPGSRASARSSARSCRARARTRAVTRWPCLPERASRTGAAATGRSPRSTSRRWST